MTILDTFYILFKSNADDLKKGAKDAEKAVSDLEKKTKETGEQAEKLGQNFVKMVEAGTAALGAYFSLGAVKTGILNAADFNRQLSIQSQLMGVNTKEMKAYAYAVEQAGGSIGGLQSSVQGAFGAASSAGLPMPGIDTLMRRYRGAIRGMTPSAQAAYLSQLGVTDPGMMRLLEASDEEFEKRIALAKQHAEVTQQEAAAADRFGQAWSRAGQSMDALFSIISADILPPVTELIEKFANFTDGIKDNKVEVYGFLGGMIALTTTLSAVIARAALGFLGLGSAASAGLAALAGGAAVATGAGVAAGTIYWHRDIADWIDSKVNGGEDARLRKSFGYMNNSKSAMDFWMSQGYSREQAAGIAANEMRESGGNASARGDGGRAHGLYQWHPDRRAAILKGTGIDVSTASAEDQRRAAAWELQTMGLSSKLMGASSPDQAAALFSSQFERPANGALEAMTRGQIALQIANNSPFNTSSPSMGGGSSSTANVKIDTVNVQTQATDASGISASIAQELNSHIRTAMSNIDDGVAR